MSAIITPVTKQLELWKKYCDNVQVITEMTRTPVSHVQQQWNDLARARSYNNLKLSFYRNFFKFAEKLNHSFCSQARVFEVPTRNFQ